MLLAFVVVKPMCNHDDAHEGDDESGSDCNRQSARTMPDSGRLQESAK